MDQTHYLLVRQVASDKPLEGLVVTCGGTAFSDTDLGRMSGMIGSGVEVFTETTLQLDVRKSMDLLVVGAPLFVIGETRTAP